MSKRRKPQFHFFTLMQPEFKILSTDELFNRRPEPPAKFTGNSSTMAAFLAGNRKRFKAGVYSITCDDCRVAYPHNGFGVVARKDGDGMYSHGCDHKPTCERNTHSGVSTNGLCETCSVFFGMAFTGIS